MKPLTLPFILAVASACFAMGAGAWERHVEDDKKARIEAVASRCRKAIADNERVAQMSPACPTDDVVTH